MNDSEKVKMFLDIGDQRLSVTVPFDRQDFVRDVEDAVGQLYTKWRRTFPAKTDREILAMVTYQFASHYSELKERHAEAASLAARCLRHAEEGLEAQKTEGDFAEDDFFD